MTNTIEDALFAENTEPSVHFEDTEVDQALEKTEAIELPESPKESESITEPDGGADDSEKIIEDLKQEIDTLRRQISQLEELKRANNRILSELGDFAAFFPDVPVENIPDSVWESVKNGAPLAASYALYEKRMAAEAMRIARINQKNASKSPGAAGTDTVGEYFSPEDVRRMSRAEVHANYSKIKESMKKWM